MSLHLWINGLVQCGVFLQLMIQKLSMLSSVMLTPWSLTEKQKPYQNGLKVVVHSIRCVIQVLIQHLFWLECGEQKPALFLIWKREFNVLLIRATILVILLIRIFLQRSCGAIFAKMFSHMIEYLISVMPSLSQGRFILITKLRIARERAVLMQKPRLRKGAK